EWLLEVRGLRWGSTALLPREPWTNAGLSSPAALDPTITTARLTVCFSILLGLTLLNSNNLLPRVRATRKLLLGSRKSLAFMTSQRLRAGADGFALIR